MNKTPIIWYETEEDFNEVLALLPLSETIGGSYQNWIQRAQGIEQSLRHAGHITSRVIVKAAAVKVWCYECNRPFTRDSLNRFVYEQIARDRGGEFIDSSGRDY